MFLSRNIETQRPRPACCASRCTRPPLPPRAWEPGGGGAAAVAPTCTPSCARSAAATPSDWAGSSPHARHSCSGSEKPCARSAPRAAPPPASASLAQQPWPRSAPRSTAPCTSSAWCCLAVTTWGCCVGEGGSAAASAEGPEGLPRASEDPGLRMVALAMALALAMTRGKVPLP
jgi:hypothetical protein